MPRLIQVQVRPKSDFPVENSDGYVLYSSLLARMQEADEETSARVHDSEFSSISVSGLSGRFEPSDRRYHKKLSREETYDIQIGVTDPDEDDVFESIVRPLVLDDGRLQVADGTLEVEEFRSEETGFRDMIEKAAGLDRPSLEIEFLSPTCIKFPGSQVTEMFPHRTAVFASLLGKWNDVVPGELEMDLSREEIGKNIIEKPDPDTVQTHSVMVNRVQDNGTPQPIIRQGFTGTCTYEFTSDAPTHVKNDVTTLALFADFSGVGSAVARGCGNTNIEVYQ